MNDIRTLHVTSREKWREWLSKNHAVVKEIWVVYYKRHTGRPRIPYEDAVEEALCFGWIDSIVRRLDDDTYAQKFTPRRPNSKWSDRNLRRFKKLLREGRITQAGLATAPKNLEKNTIPSPPESISRAEPEYIVCSFKKNALTWRNFNNMAPSYRRLYIRWIDSAKKAETRQRRLQEAISRLARNEKLGLK